jgi:predicted lipid-binding transport protein (Tim44 family)
MGGLVQVLVILFLSAPQPPLELQPNPFPPAIPPGQPPLNAPAGAPGAEEKPAGWSPATVGWFLLGSAVFLGALVLTVVLWQQRVKQRMRGIEERVMTELVAQKPRPEEPEMILTPDDVAGPMARTQHQLAALAETDDLANPDYLREWTRSVFLLVQRCWAGRNYAPAQAVMTWDLYGKHLGLLKSMRQERELNRIEELHVERLELVDLQTPAPPAPMEYAALITFRARIYFVDESTGKFRRGSKQVTRSQELWTFQRAGDVWLLDKIEMSRGRRRPKPAQPSSG